MATFVITKKETKRLKNAADAGVNVVEHSKFIDFLSSIMRERTHSLGLIDRTNVVNEILSQSADLRSFDKDTIKKYITLVVYEGISLSSCRVLSSFFPELLVVNQDSTLSIEEIAEIRFQEHPEDYVISGSVDLNTKFVTLVRGDCSKIAIPFSAFRKSGDNIKPNFKQFSIEDFGQTLCFGNYEAAVDAVLYEFDSIFRKRARARMRKLDKSFGACLRRARTQKGLRQNDLKGIDPKEIGRIERGEVKQPQKKTIVKIEKALGMVAEEILTY